MPLCRGLVILRGGQVVTVSTPEGHKGLPFGKPEKVNIGPVVDGNQKWRWETREETSLRETHEECGLLPGTLQILGGYELLEYNSRGDPSVSYTPARYIGKAEPIFHCDPDELALVGFQDLDDIAEDENFLTRRKDLITEAADLIAAATDADFVPGDQWIANSSAL